MFSETSEQANQNNELPVSAKVIPRSEHCISRSLISANALKVLYRLRNEGFKAYLVGGGVRDLLLGREPKDFDVVTDARPEQLKYCFRNAVLVGKRFRLAHIIFKGEVIEVSTFRGQKNGNFGEEDIQTPEGMILEDNVYGTFAEDADRRDFTVNALYYNIADFTVIDCHNGLMDLQHGVLRIIGEPEERYREDPVRMLRAARLSAKLGFRIEEKTEKPLFHLAYLLSQVPPARLFAEMEKLFLTGLAVNSYKMLRHYGLFNYLFPLTENILNKADYKSADQFITICLSDTDQRIQQKKPANATFLISVMLWYPLIDRIKHYQNQGYEYSQAFEFASSEVLAEQNQYTAIPKRLGVIIRDIWLLQDRLEKRHRNRVLRVVKHCRFRGAFDFLRLRAQSGEDLQEQVNTWLKFYNKDDASNLHSKKAAKSRRYKKRQNR